MACTGLLHGCGVTLPHAAIAGYLYSFKKLGSTRPRKLPVPDRAGSPSIPLCRSRRSCCLAPTNRAPCPGVVAGLTPSTGWLVSARAGKADRLVRVTWTFEQLLSDRAARWTRLYGIGATQRHNQPRERKVELIDDEEAHAVRRHRRCRQDRLPVTVDRRGHRLGARAEHRFVALGR